MRDCEEYIQKYAYTIFKTTLKRVFNMKLYCITDVDLRNYKTYEEVIDFKEHPTLGKLIKTARCGYVPIKTCVFKIK